MKITKYILIIALVLTSWFSYAKAEKYESIPLSSIKGDWDKVFTTKVDIPIVDYKKDGSVDENYGKVSLHYLPNSWVEVDNFDFTTYIIINNECNNLWCLMKNIITIHKERLYNETINFKYKYNKFLFNSNIILITWLSKESFDIAKTESLKGFLRIYGVISYKQYLFPIIVPYFAKKSTSSPYLIDLWYIDEKNVKRIEDVDISSTIIFKEKNNYYLTAPEIKKLNNIYSTLFLSNFGAENFQKFEPSDRLSIFAKYLPPFTKNVNKYEE